MLNHSSKYMDSKIAMFSILALVAIFAMALPMDTAVAQTTDVSPDGEGEYKDGDNKGKSCPFKNKTASVNTGLNI
jgi:hypothetical protein